MLIEEKVFFFR